MRAAAEPEVPRAAIGATSGRCFRFETSLYRRIWRSCALGGNPPLRAVKRAVDEDRPRRNGRFVLTGSADLLFMNRVSETLAGRATYVTLWPLTRRDRFLG